MAPAQFKVVIVGGGIAGLALGVMLERAGIDYIILEAAQEIRPLGAVVYLGPPLMRAMEQLGLLDDLIRNSNTMTGVTLMNHRLTKICRVNIDYAAERPKLYDILLSRIPAYKILFGKRVIQSSEGAEGITVRCEDGTTHHGDILVGADGGASPVRERIYQDIRRSFATSTSKAAKRSLHRSDYAPPRVEQQCIVGITEPLASKTYPVLASKSCELVMIMPKETNCMTSMATGGASGSKGPPVQPFTLHSANTTSNRTWRRLDEMLTVDGSIRHQPSPHGGTLGDLVDSTSRKMISVVVVEEKFYHTWHHGRSILIGDACHMILTSSGHGTTQAILDAMSLATLLTELPSKTPEDIEALFQVHYERRAPIAKAAVTISKHQDQLLHSRNFSGKFIRKMSSNWMSDWIKIRVGDRLFDRRPMLPFLKPVPSRGTCRNKDAPVPFLQEKKFIETEAARRRKSVSSEYSATSAYSFHRDGSTSPASSPVPGGGNQSPFASTNSNASSSSSSALDDPDRQRRRFFRRGHKGNMTSSAGGSTSDSHSHSHSRSSSFSSLSNAIIPPVPKLPRPMSTILDDVDYPAILPQSPIQATAPPLPKQSVDLGGGVTTPRRRKFWSMLQDRPKSISQPIAT
ncbi:hypothetical protein BGZ74_003213 [Mortierella antarctica]|nr:hypothetical protein BGZ74_003213 [Mortierella antarctica]